MPFWCRAYDHENNGDFDVESSRDIEDPDEAFAYFRELLDRQPAGRWVVKVYASQQVPREHVERFNQLATKHGVPLEDTLI